MAHNLFSRWRYSTEIFFSGCDQATYQQDLVVHRVWGADYEEESGGLKVWHVFVGPNCRSDYGDLRFSDRYGRELAYYLWPDFNADGARFCVRLEGATSAGTLTVHYGNASATTTSSGDAYLLFDHFDGAANAAPDSNLWDVARNGSTSATVKLDGSGGLLLAGAPNTISSGSIVSKGTYVQGIIIEYRDKIDNAHYSTTSIGSGSLVGWGGLANQWWNSYLSAGYGVINQDATTPSEEWIIMAGSDGSATKIAYGSIATHPTIGSYHTHTIRWGSNTLVWTRDGAQVATVGDSTYGSGTMKLALSQGEYSTGAGGTRTIDYVLIRAYSATPPSLLGTSRGTNPSYAGLSRLLLDDVIRFAGAGGFEVLGDDGECAVAGAGGFNLSTTIRSAIQIAGAGSAALSTHLALAPAEASGAGGVSQALRLRTPIIMEGGVGLVYAAPVPIQFDVSTYKFESLTVSRSAQDALWKCDGKIDGLDAPLAYKAFDIKVPDHVGTLHTIFYGFVPGRDHIQAVAANKSIAQGYDAGFYLTKQYLPDGDLSYLADYNWPPMNLLKYWLGEETNQVGSHSRWEQVSGIMPYRIHDPTTWGHPYTPKDWTFQPKTSKMQAIQQVCEYSGMVFLVKWQKINGVLTPCAYLVHEDDIDDPDHGLDLPGIATFSWPDPYIAGEIRVTLRSDERYNRIIVRSSSPSGAWFEAVRETAALQCGDELPIEYLEERGDLPENADHAGWCASRADELYAYYTAYAYTYTMTLIDRTDLELYQRCQFHGFVGIPDGEVMRIVSIKYVVLPTHTNVEITVTPDSRLSDLRRLQRSQSADTVSEMQTVAQSQIDQVAAGEVGTVVGVAGTQATVELERGTDVTGRIA